MLNLAIIGCGRIAKRHLGLMPELRGVRLAGVCDIVPERAAAAGAAHGVPHFTDARALLDAVKPDVVSILTPSGSHAALGLQALAANCHVIIEKPMALRLADADALIAAAAAKQRRLYVVKQNRCNLPVVKLKEALDAGRFGKLVLGTVRVRWCRDQSYYDSDAWRGTWHDDGGVLTNQASHHIDLLQWLLGPVETVTAMTARRLVDIEAEDTGTALLRFSSGALGIIEATTGARPKDLEGSLSLLGEGGSVEIAGFAVNKIRTWQFAHPLPGDAEVMEKFSTNPPDVYGFGHRVFLQQVFDSILSSGPAPVDGAEGRKSLELINAIYESVETGRAVNLRFAPDKCRLGQ